MLSISPQTSIFIAINCVDFRLGIDGLAYRCRSLLSQDPMSGSLFVFKNRKSNAIKILTYDGQGFILYYKRWSSGKLTWWPENSASSLKVPARELLILLHNGHPKRANMAEDWLPVTQESISRADA